MSIPRGSSLPRVPEDDDSDLDSEDHFAPPAEPLPQTTSRTRPGPVRYHPYGDKATASSGSGPAAVAPPAAAPAAPVPPHDMGENNAAFAYLTLLKEESRTPSPEPVFHVASDSIRTSKIRGKKWEQVGVTIEVDVNQSDVDAFVRPRVTTR